MSTLTTTASTRRLDYLPVGLFGSVMGLMGLCVAWRLAHERFGVPLWLSTIIGAIAIAAFVGLSAAYAVKTVTAFDAVRAEFHHPIAGNLFGTILIDLLLLPIAIAPWSIGLARLLWACGAVGMLFFAWLIISRWMSERQQAAHATPAWIIPVVGVLDVPLALPSLDLPPLQGLVVLCLAVGLFFAVPLFTLILSRLLFEAPLPAALQPSLMILLAPFAVGTSTYVVAAGRFDLFAEALSLLTIFVLAVLLGRLRSLPVCCPFRIAWWAVSFPLAAAAIAELRYAGAYPSVYADVMALACLALATIVILGLLGRTLVGIAGGEMRTLSL